MSNDQSIKETLDVIRRAIEDDDSSLDLKENLLILNHKVNDDGTINIINNDSINKEDVRKILDEKINQILEKHFFLIFETGKFCKTFLSLWNQNFK